MKNQGLNNMDHNIKFASNIYKQIDKITNFTDEERAEIQDKVREKNLMGSQSALVETLDSIIAWIITKMYECAAYLYIKTACSLFFLWAVQWWHYDDPRYIAHDDFPDSLTGGMINRPILHSDKKDEDNNAEFSQEERVLKEAKELEKDNRPVAWKYHEWIAIKEFQQTIWITKPFCLKK